MPVGLLLLDLRLPGCASLKEKRSRLKPLLARLHREFNVSAAEMDRMDAWQESVVALALVSNNAVHTTRALQNVVRWVEESWPDVTLVDDSLELL